MTSRGQKLSRGGGLSVTLKVNFQFPLKRAGSSRYSPEINFISAQIFVLAEKLSFVHEDN